MRGVTRWRAGTSTGVSVIHAAWLTLMLVILVPLADRAATAERWRGNELEAAAGAIAFARSGVRAREESLEVKSRRPAEEPPPPPTPSRVAPRGDVGSGLDDEATEASGMWMDGAPRGTVESASASSPARDRSMIADADADADAERTRRPMPDSLVRSILGLVAALAMAFGTAGFVVGSSPGRPAEIQETVASPIGPMDHRGGAPNLGRPRRLMDAVWDPPEHVPTGRTEVRRILAGMAHDLRTPLARIRMAVEAALAAHGCDAQGAADLDRALRGCDDMAALLGSLLRIAAVERLDGSARRALIDLSELAAMLYEAYEPAVLDGGRTIDLDVQEGATIAGDRHLMVQAAANLLDNAQIHTPVGSRISLAVRNEGTAVLLTVSDDGRGVSDDELGRLAEPFFRTGRGRAAAGHGLGLNMVAAVACAHGGQLSFRSNQPWSGLSVTIALPRMHAAATTRPSPPSIVKADPDGTARGQLSASDGFIA